MTEKEINECVLDNYVRVNKDYLEDQIRICNELAKEYLSKGDLSKYSSFVKETVI